MQYQEISCKQACNHIQSRRLPYSYDLNIYRGCAHGCRYCFALYTHQYLEGGDYYQNIFVKTNVVEMLERQLSSSRWKGALINIGGVTDSYQPAERDYRLMPEVLKLMIRYRNPIIISTKSDLILRDYDLIDELSRVAAVNIASTVTAMREKDQARLEPGAVSSQKRLEMLAAFRKTNAVTGVHMMPVIPYITATRQNITAIFQATKEIGADYVIPGLLNLRGRTRTSFLAFARESYPRQYPRILDLYRSGKVDPAYRRELYRLIRTLLQEAGVSANYKRPLDQKMQSVGYVQQRLF